MATESKYEKARSLLIERALVPPTINFNDLQSELPADLPLNFLSIADSFSYNLSEALSLASLPFRTAQAISMDNLWNRIMLSEKIRSGYDVRLHPDTDFEKEVYRSAQEKFEEAIKDRERTETENEYDLLYDIIVTTNTLIDSGAMTDVARTVLLQAEVMIWNSLEILVKDLIEAGMNNSQELRRNFSSSDVPARWNLNRLDLASIEEVDFDLRGNFGSIVLAARELSDISAMRLIVSAALKNDSEIERLFSNRSLYELSKRRHLIVHRRAKIDKKFIKETACTQRAGEELIASPDAFIVALRASFGAGQALLKNVCGKVSQSGIATDQL